jgi:hypothetical protein
MVGEASQSPRFRVGFLNGIPSSFALHTPSGIRVRPADWSEVFELLEGQSAVLSAIRHPSTAEFLRRQLPENIEIVYQQIVEPTDAENWFVLAPRRLPVRGQELQNVELVLLRIEFL